jgi:hypothetical protein
MIHAWIIITTLLFIIFSSFLEILIVFYIVFHKYFSVRFSIILYWNWPIFFFETILVQSSSICPLTRFCFITFHWLNWLLALFIVYSHALFVYIFKKFLLSMIQNQVLNLNFLNLHLNFLLYLILIIFKTLLFEQ